MTDGRSGTVVESHRIQLAEGFAAHRLGEDLPQLFTRFEHGE